MSAHIEESVGATGGQGPVLDLSLLGQVLGRLDGRAHAHRGQVGRQVSGVGGDDDESEEPPDTRHDATGHGPASDR